MRTHDVAGRISFVLFFALFTTGCTHSAQHVDRQAWFNRLDAIDHGRISDSAIWAISADTNAVLDIERSYCAAIRIERERDSVEAVYRWYMADNDLVSEWRYQIFYDPLGLYPKDYDTTVNIGPERWIPEHMLGEGVKIIVTTANNKEVYLGYYNEDSSR